MAARSVNPIRNRNDRNSEYVPGSETTSGWPDLNVSTQPTGSGKYTSFGTVPAGTSSGA
jgi:hypothetical protein